MGGSRCVMVGDPHCVGLPEYQREGTTANETQ